MFQVVLLAGKLSSQSPTLLITGLEGCLLVFLIGFRVGVGKLPPIGTKATHRGQRQRVHQGYARSGRGICKKETNSEKEINFESGSHLHTEALQISLPLIRMLVILGGDVGSGKSTRYATGTFCLTFSEVLSSPSAKTIFPT